MQHQKKLKGTKVYLRPPQAEDCDEYIALARASVKFHRGWLTMAKTPEEFANFIERNRSESNACFLIFERSNNELAGMVNLSQIFYGPFCNAYLGYGLGANFAGRGLMAEALQLTLKFAFSDLKLHRIEANVQPENKRSIQLLKKAGFTKEGFSKKYLKVGSRWRDHERWAITTDIWKVNKERLFHDPDKNLRYHKS